VPRPLDYWLNDLDPALACWWFAVHDYPDQLIAAVIAADPKTQLAAIKERLAGTYRVPETADEIVEIALAKLVMHRCGSYGYGAGSRDGGDQADPERNRITAQWRPAEIAAKIRAISGHFRLRQVRFSQRQCWHVIEDRERRALIYCDPPYLRATQALVTRKFALSDHQRLAETLRRSSHAIAVSHRINTQIRDLYAGWAEIIEVDEVDMLITL
jgi:site-specific DNA-adenine methylase